MRTAVETMESIVFSHLFGLVRFVHFEFEFILIDMGRVRFNIKVCRDCQWDVYDTRVFRFDTFMCINEIAYRCLVNGKQQKTKKNSLFLHVLMWHVVM